MLPRLLPKQKTKPIERKPRKKRKEKYIRKEKEGVEAFPKNPPRPWGPAVRNLRE